MYFSQVQINLEKGDIAQYTPAEISSQIQRRWEHRKQGLALRVIKKPKTTRSAFNATGVTFDGEAFPEAKDSRQVTAKQGNKRRKPKNRKDGITAKIEVGAVRLSAKTALLPIGLSTVRPLPSVWWTFTYLHEEARETFRNNMKVPSFKEEVDKVRSGNTNE